MNWSSPKQLQDLLFDKLKLPIIKKTKSGASTGVKVLYQLKDKHPIIPLILEHRKLSKLYTTYTDKWINSIHPFDNRVHASILQTGTVTGRVSYINPNFQQIPKKSDRAKYIRKAIIAEKGNVLCEADFSQMDLRVLAHESGDQELTKAFINNEDIHQKTADLVGCTREQGKTLNFGIIYGQRFKSLAEDLKISEEEAKKFLRQYFYKYWGVRQWQKKVVLECEKNGYVFTFLRRKRYIKNINHKNPYKKAAAERQAWSSICSGGTAECLKLAILKVHKVIEEQAKQWGYDVKLILQVHDALIFETQKDCADKIAIQIKYLMENCCVLRVPIKINIKVGENLTKMEEI